ncbi:MAG: hypothetical protein CVU51_00240 [Deltaproteobacteria bacterium HGW-Deltaproteobacteria-1]|jgi:hypothetical protein|nr:MAG: hypothetical protein CVU51_00240 [Deltaproteobacteria bacterium HGW-Deltaproteobacteria-1]
MKKIIVFVLFIITFNYVIYNQTAFAETIIHSALYGFSINIPDDWSKRKPTKSWTYLVYANIESGANMNINVINAKGLSSIKQPTLGQIFNPYYEHARIIEKVYETDSSSNIDFFKCVYRWENGEFRNQYEGKHRLQYYAVQWVKDEKLFTLTFTDSEINFQNNIQKFKRIANSIKFDKISGEEWEGGKMLIEERGKVIAACEKGILSQGYSYVKVQKYCKCSVDYITELANKYSKAQLKALQKEKGGNFIEKDALQMCKHYLE